MFSLMFVSSQVFVSQFPTLLAVTPFKSQTLGSNLKARRNHQKHESPSKFSSISCEISTFESCRSDSSDLQEDPGFDFRNPTSSTHVSDDSDSSAMADWIQSCNRVRDIKRIHGFALKYFEGKVIYVDNNLISSYGKLGNLAEARKVFDKMSERNVVTWTAMINGYLKFGYDKEGFLLFGDFLNEGILRPNPRMFVCALNLCSIRLDYKLGIQIHAHIVKSNVRNIIIDSAVVYFYAQCGELRSAFGAFDRMKEKDVISWTAIISACSRKKGYAKEVFSMFSRMLNHELLPNEFTICSVLKACGEEKVLGFGKQLHGMVIKKMVKNDVFIGTALIDMYAKCGKVLESRKVFDSMSNRNTVTWTSIIAAYAREERGEEALRLFRFMKRRNLIANNLTVVSILRACGSIGALSTGKEVHAQILKYSIEKNVHIGSTLIWLYCKCGNYQNAFKVLHQMPSRDVVSWTAMISGCLSLGHELEALDFLKQMIKEGIEPNPYTYSSALKACANSESLLIGKSIHSVAKKNPGLSNVFVGSALIHMYAKCGFVSEAFRVFDTMPEKNLVSWKAMIMGYARNGFCQEALKLMYRMRAEGFRVDDYIFATILSACGDLECDVESSGGCLMKSL